MQLANIKKELNKRFIYLPKIQYFSGNKFWKNNKEFQNWKANIIETVIHIATSNPKNLTEEDIIKEGAKILNTWVRQEGLGDAQRDYQLEVYRPKHKVPVEDMFALPWGERITAARIASGTADPAMAQLAIEPKAADADLMLEDSARELFYALDKVYSTWGPQVLCWLVMLNLENSISIYKKKDGNTLFDVFRQIGVTNPIEFLTEMKQIERTVGRVTTVMKEL